MSLKHYYYNPNDRYQNFGDDLGDVLLKMLGVDTVWVPPHEAEIITTGTLLQRANTWQFKSGVKIWGTGWAGNPAKASEDVSTRADIDYLAVRGSLTREHVSRASTANSGVVLGDPGLLVSRPEFYGNSFDKKYPIGFVRHHSDKTTYNWADLDVFEIKAARHADLVIPEIASCETIISTSLHGCIIAEAYGIPWMRLDAPMVGRPLKWVDFVSSLTKPLEEIQEDLLGVLKADELIGPMIDISGTTQEGL